MNAMASQITSLKSVFSTVYPKLRVTGLCAWNSPVTSEFPAQKDSNAEIISIDDVIIWPKGHLHALLTWTIIASGNGVARVQRQTIICKTYRLHFHLIHRDKLKIYIKYRFFIPLNAFGDYVCKMAAVSFKPRCVDDPWVFHYIWLAIDMSFRAVVNSRMVNLPYNFG